MVSERKDVDGPKECPSRSKNEWAEETIVINSMNGYKMQCCVSECKCGKDEETGAGNVEIMDGCKSWCYTKRDKSEWGFPCGNCSCK